MFNALTVVKFAVSGVVGIGTGKIVSGIIKAHVTPETLIDKVTILAASFAMSGVAAKATKGYTDEIIDSVADTVTTTIDKFKLDAKLGRVDRKESTFEKEGLDPNDYVYDNENQKWKRRDEATKEDKQPAAS